jgi:hypothetical protein
MPAGYYAITVDAPAGMHLTTGGPVNVILGAKRNVKLSSMGISNAATIAGSVFLDVDGNGAMDAGETGLKKIKVYIDTSGDGAWQPGEPITRTDAHGNWSLHAAAPGTYPVRVLLKPTFAVTTPANGVLVVALAAPGDVDGDHLFGVHPSA